MWFRVWGSSDRIAAAGEMYRTNVSYLEFCKVI
jgi:hypothetical protein